MSAEITLERARVAAIMKHPKSMAQRGLAAYLIESGCDTDTALKILDAANDPVQLASNPFIAAMAATPNPANTGIARREPPNEESESGVFA